MAGLLPKVTASLLFKSFLVAWTQVAELLPKVTEDDYSIEPSLTQLAAMAREDPQSLAAVSSFKVSRRGIGCVRWLEPTDVRGLDVNVTVRLTRGVVEVRHPLQLPHGSLLPKLCGSLA